MEKIVRRKELYLSIYDTIARVRYLNINVCVLLFAFFIVFGL